MGLESPAQKRGYCTLCRSRCGATYDVRDERIVGVRPDPEHPTGAAVCAKGRAAGEIAHSPRRLRTPLRRTNPKTADDPGWREITWEEAMTEIAERLGEIRVRDGAEAVAYAVTSPSGTPISDSIDWVERFIRLFGSPNIVYATELCNWHKDHAHAFTFGRGMPPPDYENADLILLWGHNPARSWLAQSAAIGTARNRGTRVAAIDPRRAGNAQTADRWLRIRPGTDGALALTIANLLITRGDYDDEFVRRWTNGPLLVRTDTGALLRGRDIRLDDPDCYVGWDGRRAVPYDRATAAGLELYGEVELETARGAVDCVTAFSAYARACAYWTLERGEQETTIPRAEIDALATEIGNADAVAYHAWTGVGQHTNATQTERAIACLYALTGSYDSVGGNVVPAPLNVNAPTSFDQLDPAQRAKALGIEQRPIGPPSQGWVTADDVYTAILQQRPYAVRALVGFGANMLLSQPGTERGREALRQLDFHVHCDLFMNPTAELADIVLPISSPWEREGLRLGFDISHAARELVQLRQQVIPRYADTRSDAEVVFDLAVRLGMGGDFYGGSIDAAWEHVLEPLPFGLSELRAQPEGIRVQLPRQYRKYAEPADDPTGFATETGLVELYSELLHRHGYDPLPRYVEPAETPDDDYPYVLTSTKNGKYCHTQHRGISSLRSRSPEPVVEISPVLAAERGIADGDWVVLRTRRAAIRMKARFDESLDPAVVVSEFGWWERSTDLGRSGYDPFSDSGSNYNRLVDTDYADPVSGATPLRSQACTVELAEPAAPWQRPFTVREKYRESDETATLRLIPRDESPPPRFVPGEHIELTIEDPSVDSEAVTRSYSLSGADGEHLQVTVKREGQVSRRLVDEIETGDTVLVGSPRGRFRLPLDPDLPVTIIAGGVGVTPFISYLETLPEHRPDAEVHVYYAVRDGAHLAYGRRLRELRERLPGLRLSVHFTRPTAEDRIGVDYDTAGRITADEIPRELIERRTRFYLCGPDAMLTDVRAGLRARGVPDFDVFYERFTTPAPTWHPDPDAIHTVEFSRSGRSVTWRGDSGTLLELAEREGVPLSSGCRTGECESCAVSIVAGSVRYLVDDADPDDDARCISCQAVPGSDLVLDA